MIVYNVAGLFALKKEKAAFRSILTWVSKNLEAPEIQLAKALCSVQVHILIEMEGSRTGPEAIAKATGYKLEEWSRLSSSLIKGEMKADECLSEIRRMIEDV